MTPPFTAGAVVFVQPRAPAMRYQGWHGHGCWPAVVRRIDRSWVFVEPCGASGDRLVMLSLERDNVATEPCEACAQAWTAAGWQQLGRAG